MPSGDRSARGCCAVLEVCEPLLERRQLVRRRGGGLVFLQIDEREIRLESAGADPIDQHVAIARRPDRRSRRTEALVPRT